MQGCREKLVAGRRTWQTIVATVFAPLLGNEKRSDRTMTTIDFTRWFLALYFTSVASFYTVRIIVLARRYGESPVFSGQPGTLHYATHLAFRVFRIVILGVCVARIPWPQLDRYLIPFDQLWEPAILMTGNVLLATSFAMAVAIHMYMGKNWRSGTRNDDRTELMTRGPFALSQNPMLLCVLVAQSGFFLTLPSGFTLVCWVVGIWAVTTQAKIETGLLRRRFGAAYDEYAEKTPRWLLFR